MKTILKTMAAFSAAATLSACVEIEIDPDALSGAMSPSGSGQTSSSSGADARFNQTFGFTRGTGSGGTMVQTVLSGAGRPGNARVCFVNAGPVPAELAHGVAGINPLRAAPGGGQSCANFSSGARVSFTLVEQLGFVAIPARADRPFVYTLSPFDGDILQLRWQAN